MNTISIIFATAAILALILLIISLVLAEYPRRKNGKEIVLPKAFAWLKFEFLGVFCLVFFICFGVLSAYAAIDKCENCNRIVTSAYCIYCGAENEGYVDNVSALAGKNICPKCQVPCDTPYCGDCGTQTVLAEK